jgi:hypothetical protein
MLWTQLFGTALGALPLGYLIRRAPTLAPLFAFAVWVTVLGVSARRIGADMPVAIVWTVAILAISVIRIVRIGSLGWPWSIPNATPRARNGAVRRTAGGSSRAMTAAACGMVLVGIPVALVAVRSHLPEMIVLGIAMVTWGVYVLTKSIRRRPKPQQP